MVDQVHTSFSFVECLAQLVECRRDGVFAEHRHLPLHEVVVENHFDRWAEAAEGKNNAVNTESRTERRKTTVDTRLPTAEAVEEKEQRRQRREWHRDRPTATYASLTEPTSQQEATDG